MGYAAHQGQTNSDLIWGLDHLKQLQVATDFIKCFENRLCVYSPSVKKLYSNYSIHFAETNRSSMVVLPNPYAFQDTFNHIPSESVEATGLHIIPGEMIGRIGLQLVLRQRKSGKFSAPIGFKRGIRHISKYILGHDPFLPVLMKGDLREINTQTPCLHLHRIRIPKLQSLSSLGQSGIKSTVTEQVIGICRDAEVLSNLKKDNNKR